MCLSVCFHEGQLFLLAVALPGSTDLRLAPTDSCLHLQANSCDGGGERGEAEDGESHFLFLRPRPRDPFFESLVAGLQGGRGKVIVS